MQSQFLIRGAEQEIIGVVLLDGVHIVLVHEDEGLLFEEDDLCLEEHIYMDIYGTE